MQRANERPDAQHGAGGQANLHGQQAAAQQPLPGSSQQQQQQQPGGQAPDLTALLLQQLVGSVNLLREDVGALRIDVNELKSRQQATQGAAAQPAGPAGAQHAPHAPPDASLQAPAAAPRDASGRRHIVPVPVDAPGTASNAQADTMQAHAGGPHMHVPSQHDMEVDGEGAGGLGVAQGGAELADAAATTQHEEQDALRAAGQAGPGQATSRGQQLPSAAGTGSDSAVPGMPIDQGEDDEDEEEDDGEEEQEGEGEVEDEDEGAVCLFCFVVRSDDTISVCLNIDQTQLDPADAAPTRREQALEWQVRALLLVASHFNGR